MLARYRHDVKRARRDVGARLRADWGGLCRGRAGGAGVNEGKRNYAVRRPALGRQHGVGLLISGSDYCGRGREGPVACRGHPGFARQGGKRTLGTLPCSMLHAPCSMQHTPCTLQEPAAGQQLSKRGGLSRGELGGGPAPAPRALDWLIFYIRLRSACVPRVNSSRHKVCGLRFAVCTSEDPVRCRAWKLASIWCPCTEVRTLWRPLAVPSADCDVHELLAHTAKVYFSMRS